MEFSQSYGLTNGSYGYTYSTANMVRCEGAINVTFTWTGPAAPPPHAVVTETGSADAYATPGGPGSFNNGVGVADGVPKYWIKTNPGPAFSYTRNPYANATCSNPGSNGAVATVYHSASASPVSLELSGTVVSGGTHNLLIGQGVTATVVSGFATNVTWSIPGQTFGGFSVDPYNPQTGAVIPFSPGNGPSTHWYWEKGGSFTVSASVALSTGGQPIGTVNAIRDVTVQEPSHTMNTSSPCGGVCEAASYFGDIVVRAAKDWGDPDPSKTLVGMQFTGTVTTPSPFLALQGEGDWLFVQLVDIYRKKVFPDGRQGLTTTGSYWLDTNWGYRPIQTTSERWPANGDNHSTSDSPADSISPFDLQYHFNDSFLMFQLYRPPGLDSTWVPLHFVHWSWNAMESRPYGPSFPYQIPGSSVVSDVTAGTHTHPEWTNRAVFPSYPPEVVQ